MEFPFFYMFTIRTSGQHQGGMTLLEVYNEEIHNLLQNAHEGAVNGRLRRSYLAGWPTN